MNIGSYLRLIRWKNLLILTATLFIIKFGFIDLFTTHGTLDIFHFSILTLSMVFIAAGGYIINDIEDIQIDLINKPSKVLINNTITFNRAYDLYFFFTIIGVLAGFYTANFLNFPVLAIIPILIAYLLYLYSTTLKKLPLIGNILIASFVSLTILSLAFFDLILINKPEIIAYHYTLFNVITDFALFAFALNLIRELVKDIEDIEGDKLLNINTLPILIGIKKSKIVLLILSILLQIGMGYYILTFLTVNRFIFYYFIFGICAPLLYFSIKTILAKSKSDFKYLSTLLKISMMLGILAILLISLTLKNVL